MSAHFLRRMFAIPIRGCRHPVPQSTAIVCYCFPPLEVNVLERSTSFQLDSKDALSNEPTRRIQHFGQDNILSMMIRCEQVCKIALFLSRIQTQ